jgi:hypothetical protein
MINRSFARYFLAYAIRAAIFALVAFLAATCKSRAQAQAHQEIYVHRNADGTRRDADDVNIYMVPYCANTPDGDYYLALNSNHTQTVLFKIRNGKAMNSTVTAEESRKLIWQVTDQRGNFFNSDGDAYTWTFSAFGQAYGTGWTNAPNGVQAIVTSSTKQPAGTRRTYEVEIQINMPGSEAVPMPLHLSVTNTGTQSSAQVVLKAPDGSFAVNLGAGPGQTADTTYTPTANSPRGTYQLVAVFNVGLPNEYIVPLGTTDLYTSAGQYNPSWTDWDMVASATDGSENGGHHWRDNGDGTETWVDGNGNVDGTSPPAGDGGTYSRPSPEMPGTWTRPKPSPTPTPTPTPSPTPPPPSPTPSPYPSPNPVPGPIGDPGPSQSGSVYDEVKAALLDAGRDGAPQDSVSGDFAFGEDPETDLTPLTRANNKVKGTSELLTDSEKGLANRASRFNRPQDRQSLPQGLTQAIPTFSLPFGNIGSATVNLSIYATPINVFRNICLLALYIMFWWATVRIIRLGIA